MQSVEDEGVICADLGDVSHQVGFFLCYNPFTCKLCCVHYKYMLYLTVIHNPIMKGYFLSLVITIWWYWSSQL
jgi:hypothetical protein